MNFAHKLLKNKHKARFITTTLMLVAIPVTTVLLLSNQDLQNYASSNISSLTGGGPSINILNPKTNQVLKNDFKVESVAIDNDGLFEHIIKLDGKILKKCKSKYPCEVETNPGFYTAGTKQLTVTAKDKKGNESTKSINVIIKNDEDTIDPYVDVFSPKNGARLENKFTIRTNAGGGIIYHRMYINDKLLKNCGRTGVCLFDVNPESYTSGTYSIIVKAEDSAGNKSEKTNKVVFVNRNNKGDTENPVITAVNPKHNENIAKIYNVVINASDASNITNFDLYFDGELIHKCGSVKTCKYALDTTIYDDRFNYLKAVVSDQYNNESSMLIPLKVNNSGSQLPSPTGAPSITPTVSPVGNVDFIYPKDKQTIKSTINVNLKATDTDGVRQVTLLIDNKSIWTSYSDTLKWQVNTKNYNDGWHEMIARVLDKKGKYKTYKINVLIQNNINTPTPTTGPLDGTFISFDNLQNDQSVSGEVPVNISTTDADGIKKIALKLDNWLVIDAIDNITTINKTANFTFNTKYLSNKTYTLTAEITDGKNNLTKKDVRVFVNNGGSQTPTVTPTSTPKPTNLPTITPTPVPTSTPTSTPTPSQSPTGDSGTVINFTTPQNNQSVSGLIDIIVSASDADGISKISMFLDGDQFMIQSGSSLKTGLFTQYETNGNHKIKASVEDKKGNITSIEITINVQN